jgi:hypothetical protein
LIRYAGRFVLIMSRYEALTERLRTSSDDVVVLTFEELDELVGGLPPSARKHAPWWGNAKKPTGQSRFWMQANRLARPDMSNFLVAFRRMDVDAHATSKPRPRAASTPVESGVQVSRPAALTPSGDHVRTTIAYEWQHAGTAASVKDKLVLPVPPPRPGVYRFVISHPGGSTSTYVGETDNLFRQMGNYRNPGPSQTTDERLNALLRAVLESGGSVAVDVVTAGLLGGEALDLSTRAGRSLVEHTALCELDRIGAAVENL